jgi:cobalt/nickel transport protein
MGLEIEKGERTMKRAFIFLTVVLLLWPLQGRGFAHFGMVIPSESMVMQGEKRVLRVVTSFSHPMEMMGMDFVKPVQFGVLTRGKKINLRDDLEETTVMGRKAWQIDYKIKLPGVYQFFMEPSPYWEPAEEGYIIHYTKTIVSAFGAEKGWDDPVGLKTEIIPLTRPFGVYSGNVFQGIVMLNGKPVPYSEVEVEFYNRDGKAEAINEYFVTQVIKADSNGVFTYGVPRPGWWGFAALNQSDHKIKHQGVDKNVELGAVIWVEFKEW